MSIISKIIEGRSKKSKEKCADHCIAVATWAFGAGFGIMLSFFVKLFKFVSFGEAILTFIAFGLCLKLSQELRDGALDTYDELDKEESLDKKKEAFKKQQNKNK